MLLGALGWFYSYSASHVSLDEVKTMLAEEASSGGGHGEVADTHAVAEESHEATTDSHDAEAAHADAAEGHDDEHAEHVMHQIHNRPYSALYVAAVLLYDDCTWSLSFLCNSICFTSRLVTSII